MRCQIISSFAVLLLAKDIAALAIESAARQPATPSSPEEPGQAEYRADLRDVATAAIDALLFSPLPAEVDINLAQDYRSVEKQQSWTKELMYGIIQELRSGFLPADSAAAVEQQKELYRAVEQGSEQFSQALYKTIAAVNAAEAALAAPAAGIRRALERRGYIVIDQSTFRSLENGTGDGANSTEEPKRSYWPLMQTAGNVIDLTKCVKDSMTGHYDHINVFEVVPVVGPLMTRMPGASIILDMLDKQVKPFKRFGYAASCIKELSDTHWGPNDDELPGGEQKPMGIANALCGAINSADGTLKSAFKTATGLAGVSYNVVNHVADKAIGAVPVFGGAAVNFKHGVENAAGNVLSAGAHALDGAQKAARGALSMKWLG